MRLVDYGARNAPGPNAGQPLRCESQNRAWQHAPIAGAEAPMMLASISAIANMTPAVRPAYLPIPLATAPASVKAPNSGLPSKVAPATAIIATAPMITIARPSPRHSFLQRKTR